MFRDLFMITFRCRPMKERLLIKDILDYENEAVRVFRYKFITL